jgi:hypothetical protein
VTDYSSEGTVVAILHRWDENDYWDLSPFDAEICVAVTGSDVRKAEVTMLLGGFRNGSRVMSFADLARFLIYHLTHDEPPNHSA